MRYTNDRTIKAGSTKATNKAAIKLREEFAAGNITVQVIVIGSKLRLDQVAFRYMGDATMWWAIAALSDIGWGMQLPPGTRIVVPTNRQQIEELF